MIHSLLTRWRAFLDNMFQFCSVHVVTAFSAWGVCAPFSMIHSACPQCCLLHVYWMSSLSFAMHNTKGSHSVCTICL